jgi:hypothetical protein
MKQKYKGQIEALKEDLKNATKRLLSLKYEHEKSLIRMLDCEGDIETRRVRLSELGVNTLRKKPFGNIKYKK